MDFYMIKHQCPDKTRHEVSFQNRASFSPTFLQRICCLNSKLMASTFVSSGGAKGGLAGAMAPLIIHAHTI